MNYIIDEGMVLSKGSNSVISYLNDFFDNYGLGETAADLHCDNCSGQNKKKWGWFFDEGMVLSKGSNSVISYLNNFFDNYGLGETAADLHCDNCSGQNKKKYVIWYLCWRVIHVLHQEVTLNFLIAGHTKFAPNWGFGLMKETIQDLSGTLLLLVLWNPAVQSG